MAQLTWRPVDAPDFSNSMNGIRSFSSLLDQAFEGAQKGLDKYEQIQDDRVNQGAMAELAAIQDPALAAAAVQDLLKRPDAKRYSAAVFDLAMRRPGQVVDQATGKIQFDRTNNDWTRDLAFQNKLDASGPLVQQLRAAQRNNDVKAIAALEGQLSKNFEGAPIDRVLKFYDSQANSEQSYLGMANTRQSMFQGKVNFENAQEDRTFDQTAKSYAGSLLANYQDRDSAFAAAKSMLDGGKIDGRMFQQIAHNLGIANFPDISQYADPLAGIGSGGGAGDSSRIMNYQARAAGFTAVPDSVKTLGQASEFALGVNRAGVASSAMGTYQIVGDTLRRYAPKVFGQNWQNVDFNVVNQDKIARAIFDDNKHSAAALRKQWISLDENEARALVGKSWDQARDVISRNETSSVASMLIGQAAAAGQNVATGAASMETNAGNNLPNKFFELAGSTETARQTAVRLAKENPGVNAAWLEGQIIKLQGEMAKAGGKRTNINSAMVGQALMDNAGAQSAREFWGRAIPDFLAGNTIGDDLVVNLDGARGALKEYINGSLDDTVMSNTMRNGTVQVQQQAQARVQQAQAALQAKINAAAARGQTPRVDREIQALAQATQVYNEVTRMRDAPGQNLGPGYEKPAAPSGGRAAAPIAQASAKTPAQPAKQPQQSKQPQQAAPARPVNFDRLNRPLSSLLEQRRQDENRIRNDRVMSQQAAPSRAAAEKAAQERARTVAAFRNKVTSSFEKPGEFQARQAAARQRAAGPVNNTVVANGPANRVVFIQERLKQPLSPNERMSLVAELNRLRSRG